MEAPASIELANDRFTQVVGGHALVGRRFREALPEHEAMLDGLVEA